MPSMAQVSSSSKHPNAPNASDVSVTTPKVGKPSKGARKSKPKSKGKGKPRAGDEKSELDGIMSQELGAEQDVSLLAIGTKNELPLQFRWGLWYSAPKNAEADAAHKWDTERMKMIVEFGSVEEFWRVFNNLTPPSKLSQGSDLQLFRAGVRPAWEDPFNAKGGSWTIKVPKEDLNKLDTIWFNTVLTMIGDNFDDADDICGISVSARPKYNRLQLWTRYADDKAVSLRIGEQFKGLNRLKSGHKIQFLSHDDAKGYSRDLKGSEIIL